MLSRDHCLNLLEILWNDVEKKFRILDVQSLERVPDLTCISFFFLLETNMTIFAIYFEPALSIVVHSEGCGVEVYGVDCP